MAHIEPALKATERYGAISELLDRLTAAGAITRSAEPELSAAFRRREEVMSTGIGFGIAVPHVFSPGVAETVVAFGRSLAGVPFAALDSFPVEFIFLFIFPADAATRDSDLKSLSRTTRRLDHRQMRNALRRCTTAQEIQSILEGL